MTIRDDNFDTLVNDYQFDISLAEQDVLDVFDGGPVLSRYALVEHSDIMGMCISLHDTPAAAAHTNATQREAEMWDPLLIADLDTGLRYEANRADVDDIYHVTFDSEPTDYSLYV